MRQFRTAVREGKIEAIEVPVTRIELPKKFNRRGTEGETYTKQIKEMLFEVTPEFDAWFAEINAQLSGRSRGTRPLAVSVERIESGAVDFKALAAATRKGLQDQYQRGQALGNTHKKPKGRGKKRR